MCLPQVREAAERYEAQAATQRARLVAEGDLRLEQAEAARCEGPWGGKGEGTAGPLTGAANPLNRGG